MVCVCVCVQTKWSETSREKGNNKIVVVATFSLVIKHLDS